MAAFVLCDITHPLRCFASALLPCCDLRQKPTNGATSQLAAGWKAPLFFHHVPCSTAYSGKLSAFGLADHSFCLLLGLFNIVHKKMLSFAKVREHFLLSIFFQP